MNLANELRIGNLVFQDYVNKNVVVTGLFADSDECWYCDLFSEMEASYRGPIQSFKPIELTPDWLLRMGFEHRTYTHFDKSVSHDLYLTKDDLWAIHIYEGAFNLFHMDRHEGSRMVASLKTVHSAQNIMFLLTGKELTINP